jgi:pimeloyl-ACP methyl ester carboxylesterase
VERLVVVDIAPRDYFWIAHRGEFAAMNELDLGRLQSRAEAELQFEARVPGLGMRRFLATNLERMERGQGERAAGGQGECAAGGWRWIVNLPVLTAALPRLEKDSLAPDDRFTGPALFIVGGRSRYVEAADHEAIRRHFPAARIEVIAECGHNPHMDRREDFVRLVLGA